MKQAFIVPGEPQPWERVTPIPYRDKTTGKLRTRMVTPEGTRAFQEKVGLCAKAAGIVPVVGGAEVMVVAYLSREPLEGPDWDNLAKTVCDALNGIAWADDRQIVHGIGVKRRDEKNPRTEVLIRSVHAATSPRPLATRPIGCLVPSYHPPSAR